MSEIDDLGDYSLEDLNGIITRMEEAALGRAMTGDGQAAADDLGPVYALRDEVWDRKRRHQWQEEAEAPAWREAREGNGR